MPSCGTAGTYSSFIPIFFKEISILSSTVAVSVYISTTVPDGSLFSTSSSAFMVCTFSDDVCSDWQEVIPRCSFDLHFSNNEQC